MKHIPVGIGKFTIVDDCDYENLSQYLWTSNGYAYINRTFLNTCGISPPENGILMSRIILGLLPGDGMEADHINHNLLDNRRSNLRVVTRRQNQQNRKPLVGTSSKYKGVLQEGRKWKVGITIDGKRKHLGYYDDEDHAAHAYNLAARRYFGKYACLNKVG